jgi:hypothetical protein
MSKYAETSTLSHVAAGAGGAPSGSHTWYAARAQGKFSQNAASPSQGGAVGAERTARDANAAGARREVLR